MRILLADDEQGFLHSFKSILERGGHNVISCSSGVDALSISDNELKTIDVAILDQQMPQLNGLETGKRLIERNPRIVLIMLTAYDSIEYAVQAIRDYGFYDYFRKPIDQTLLQAALARAKRFVDLTLLDNEIRGQLLATYKGKYLIGNSPAFRQCLGSAQEVAKTDASVLILGESGTGKELVARYIHEQSQRKNCPFVAIDCSALPENLLESELFGHEKGAFTGAYRQHNGRFEQAHSGTLFLDEIGDLPLHLQPKLLRVLQEREVLRVGGSRPVSIDIRIIAATSRNLSGQVKENKFNEALFYRLNVYPICLPLLRERQEDIRALAMSFLDRYRRYNPSLQGIHSDAMAALQSYSWPGNVRQLENAIESAIIKAQTNQITKGDLPPEVLIVKGDPPEASTSEKQDREATPENDILEQEKARVVDALNKYESGMAKALEQKEDIQRIRLTDIGQQCQPPISHSAISQFFNPKEPDEDKGYKRIKIIQDLANQFPRQWPLLRKLKQWPKSD